eukprot:PhM_4_TR16441/c0_g1_i1/m.1830
MYAFGVLVLAVVAVVYPVVGADAQQQHKLFPFDLQTNATSWEFQLNTPLDPAAVNTTQDVALRLMRAFAADKQNHFKIKKSAAFAPATCNLRYWLVGAAASPAASFVYVKMRQWTSGNRANTTDLTIKVKRTNNQTVLLTQLAENVTQKLENDVHCTANAFSVSITNRDLPASANPDNFTTLADVVPYFSPNLASYLNISSDAALNQTKHGEALLSKAKVKFIIQEKGELVEMKSKATYMHVTWWAGSRSSSPPIGVGAELSLRVKRAEASDGGSAEQSALATTQALFTSMVNSTIDNNSCVPPAL